MSNSEHALLYIGPRYTQRSAILCWAGHRQKQTYGKYTPQGRWEIPPLYSQEVLVGSSVPSALSVMSPHRGRTPAGAGWDRLGVRANFNAAWRFLDADGQQEKLTEIRSLCRCSGKWVLLPSLAMRLKLILVYRWRRTEEMLTPGDRTKDKAIPSPHSFAANTVLWVKKTQQVCSFRELIEQYIFSWPNWHC